jgi:hypothetical protein
MNVGKNRQQHAVPPLPKLAAVVARDLRNIKQDRPTRAECQWLALDVAARGGRAQALAIAVPPLKNERAQGMPGEGLTHGPPADKKRAVVTTGAAEHPAFPA